MSVCVWGVFDNAGDQWREEEGSGCIGNACVSARAGEAIEEVVEVSQNCGKINCWQEP
jgi:hypothetical protein